jgi:alkanesulfonate monooxygenase SsuD/methylene tetrahydromethanopterin reductase-like flavin-dependent oxidoreductase (luciferase family)
VKLGVYLGWHVHPWQALVGLVLRAESLGYAAAFVDGDASMLAVRREAACLDGWTVTTALLAKTTRIQVGSLRLAHHWNAARLAQAAATAEALAPGRLRFQIAAGDHPEDARFGLPFGPAGERLERLEETLEALRALWRGETVSRAGRHVRLDGARVRPTPPGGRLPVTVAARRPRALEIVAKHADVWEVNLPPLAERVAEAAQRLEAACHRQRRDPASLARSMLLFARPGFEASEALAEYRRLNPWFRDLSEAEARRAVLVGDAASVRARVAGLAGELGLELPVLDLSGLPEAAALELLEVFAPPE